MSATKPENLPSTTSGYGNLDAAPAAFSPAEHVTIPEEEQVTIPEEDKFANLYHQYAKYQSNPAQAKADGTGFVDIMELYYDHPGFKEWQAEARNSGLLETIEADAEAEYNREEDARNKAAGAVSVGELLGKYKER
jgi:hypothetical protein